MSATTVLDVLVIGSGITGLSTLVHLKARGISRVALAADAARAPSSRRLPGVLMGGQLDNFTRISHRHGQPIAAALWRFGDAAFDALIAHARAAGIEVATGRRLRLVTSEAELREAEQAVRELQGSGFTNVTLENQTASKAGATPFGDRVIAVQDDGARAGLLDSAALATRLEQATAEVPRVGRVRALSRPGGALTVTLEDGSTLRAEIVVLAAHLGIKTLVPELDDALVPYADQWGIWERAPTPAISSGTVVTATHANEWGAVDGQRVIYGGARYLRPLGGMEAKSAAAEERITTHLATLAKSTFRGVAGGAPSSVGAGLDIRPCDELPVIGPMYGESRLLIGAGYMGLGLTMGFHAGACLAELVVKGSAPALPRILWPERLRSLEA
jgi:glycine/D-amino acid oxidase-like deaminating enzyme